MYVAFVNLGALRKRSQSITQTLYYVRKEREREVEQHARMLPHRSKTSMKAIGH